jgi:hypothetical protein
MENVWSLERNRNRKIEIFKHWDLHCIHYPMLPGVSVKEEEMGDILVCSKYGLIEKGLS